jgi:primosomal replication protein N
VEWNELVISGKVIELEKPRKSPAGVPHLRFLIEHRSKQIEAGLPRQATCQVSVLASGSAAVTQCQQLSLGQHITARGFVTRSHFKDDAYRLVLHAQVIETQSTNENDL